MDPKTSKILTIQFQRLSTDTGAPIGPLTILKEWESGEKEMVVEFLKSFETTWNFIPIGNNLLFDFCFLSEKVKQYVGKSLNLKFFRDKPFIDLKPMLIIKNAGSFRGYDKLIGKSGQGAKIREWYNNKEYEKIVSYVNQEAKDFTDTYMTLKREIPKIRLPKEP